MKQVFQFIWESIKNYRWFYLAMFLAPIFGAFYKPVSYYALKLMVDIMSSTASFTFNDLIYPITIYIVADILLTIMWRLAEFSNLKAEPYVKRGIILNAMAKALSFRYSFFLSTSSGSTTSKIKGLLDGYSNVWAQVYYGVWFWFIASIVSAASIFWINGYLGLIISSWALLFVFSNYKFSKKINLLSEQENQAKHKIIGEVADNISNVQAVKFFTTRNYEQQRLENSFDNDYIPKELRSLWYGFKTSIFNDITGIVFFIIIIVTMIKFKQLNLIGNGDFVFIFGMLFQFQDNLWRLMQDFHKFAKHSGDLKSSLSLYESSDSEYHSTNAQPSLSSAPAIEFSNINFAYNQNNPIFRNLNLAIKPGEKIGIVGITGAGKSTLTNLLLKTIAPQHGQITIDGIDIADLNNDQLRQLIALIPQDINLFHRSLFDNIHYGNLSATPEEVIAASKKAHVDEFIQTLPEKYDTMVGERGVKLSGGQRQRIAIARAILKNAPILVLDEATSSLDSITEQYIQQSIAELIVGKTVIAIAHRLSTLKDMDRIIVLNEGQIVESGTHDELLAQSDSLYAKIWHSQYSNKTLGIVET